MCVKLGKIPILIFLDRVVASSRSDNLIKVIMEAFMIGGGLPQNQIAQNLICFGAKLLMFFKGEGLVSQNKFMIVMLPIFWGSIAWPIGQTWYNVNLVKFAFGDPPSAFVANST